MLIYVFLLLLPLLVGLIIRNDNPKSKKKYLSLVFGVLCIVAAIRGNSVGVDTSTYISTFETIKNYGVSAYNRTGGSIEYGYIYSNLILGLIFSHSQSILIFFSIITYYGVARIIYLYSTDVVMSSFLYIMWSFASSMNTSRQHMACSIALISISYLFEKKYKKSILFLIIAFMFHQTIFFFVPFFLMPLFTRKNNPEKAIKILMPVFIFAFFIMGSIINLVIKYFPRYYIYIYGIKYGGGDGDISIPWVIIYSLFILGMFFLLTTYSHAIEKNEMLKKYSHSELCMYLFFTLLVIIQIETIFFKASLSGIISRFGVYTRNGLFFVIPFVLHGFLDRYFDKKSKNIILTFFYISFLAFGINMIEQDGYKVIPYVIF